MYVLLNSDELGGNEHILKVLLELLKKYPQVQIAACSAQIERGTQGNVQQDEEEIWLYDQNKMLDFFFRIHGESE